MKELYLYNIVDMYSLRIDMWNLIRKIYICENFQLMRVSK
jgi:hypothetical protein